MDKTITILTCVLGACSTASATLMVGDAERTIYKKDRTSAAAASLVVKELSRIAAGRPFVIMPDGVKGIVPKLSGGKK